MSQSFLGFFLPGGFLCTGAYSEPVMTVGLALATPLLFRSIPGFCELPGCVLLGIGHLNRHSASSRRRDFCLGIAVVFALRVAILVAPISANSRTEKSLRTAAMTAPARPNDGSN
ncbi:hypothetical protein FHT69_002904 [Rhizobium sp. BK008]|nr:hypothetical protein [Rhizobium sp. BK008]